MVKKKLGGAKNRKRSTVAAVGFCDCCRLLYSHYHTKRLDVQVKAPEVESQDGLKQPAHLKKKLTKKVQFLERVADSKKGALAARAGVKKKSHKQRRKKALPDLSSLADILAEVGQQPNQLSQQPQESKQHNKQKGRTEQITTSKARRVVTQLESDRMQHVLAHPQFMANPLAAIRNHLEATLPAAAPPKAQQHNKLRKGQQRRKKAANADLMQS